MNPAFQVRTPLQLDNSPKALKVDFTIYDLGLRSLHPFIHTGRGPSYISCGRRVESRQAELPRPRPARLALSHSTRGCFNKCVSKCEFGVLK